MNIAHRIACLAALGVALGGCGNTTTNPSPDMTVLTPGGFVTGALDTHCKRDGGVLKAPTSQASCKYRPDGGDASAEYGETMFNSEADDDDCKYHVKVTAIPVYQSTNTTFTVTVSRTVDGAAAAGANAMAEVFLSDSHAGLTDNMKTTESPPGTYTIGPVQFDASGRWTLRFHLYGDCFDFAEDSPHGHAAFYVDIP